MEHARIQFTDCMRRETYNHAGTKDPWNPNVTLVSISFIKH